MPYDLRNAPRWRGVMPFAVALSFALAAPAWAQASDRWLADETEASAALPAARSVTTFAGAALSCAAQRWTLALEPNDAVTLDDGAAVLTVDGRPFELAAMLEDGKVSMRLPREALEPLKTGLRMEVSFSGALAEKIGKPVFALRGSKIAITAVEDRCTLRDMSGYQAVSFTPYSSYINLAQELRSDDIKAFATSTASQPKVDVAMAEMGEGQRVLFTRLCGSSWYYGLSGCNVTGFVPQAEPVAEGAEDQTPTWKTVYDTENVSLYLDRSSKSHGWPDVVTLPVRGPGTGLIWRWNGNAYALKGELPDEEEQPVALPLRPTRD